MAGMPEKSCCGLLTESHLEAHYVHRSQGEVHLDPMLKLVSARFHHCEVIISPFVFDCCFGGDNLT